jgi:hypothetical protein
MPAEKIGVKPINPNEIVLTPTSTQEDPADKVLFRITTMRDVNDTEFQVKLQQGVYSKADLQNLRDQIDALLAE